MRIVEDDSFCQEELHGSNVVLLRQVTLWQTPSPSMYPQTLLWPFLLCVHESEGTFVERGVALLDKARECVVRH